MTDRAQLDRWMTDAADGDRGAIDPLFVELWPIALAYATRFVGNATLAEDCAQDALVRLFGQLDRYERGRDALTWALTLVTWQCRTARRKIARRNEAPETPDHRAIDGAAQAVERALVRSAVATLSSLEPRDIEVIAAAISDDDELRCQLAPATFRKRLERAVARLRSSWRSRHGTL
jgi:DNA-directed RNA polymerase specialized sigma24 family protein